MNKKTLTIISCLLAIPAILVLWILIIKGVDYMTEHQKVHVICENMCMEEGMTKEQVLELTSLKTETVELTFTYRQYKYSDTLREGTVVIPLTFYKYGNMVLISKFQVELSLTGAKEPTVNTSGLVPKVTFYGNSNNIQSGVNLICTEVDKFRKYVALVYPEIFQKDVLYKPTIKIFSDKLELNSTINEAGTVDFQPSVPYMADNTD